LVTARQHGVPVFSEIELAYRISPAPIIAITGTNGKTTTTALVGEIMKADARHTYIAGNIVAGETRLPLVRAAYRASASDVIVAEISSFQLEWVTSFRPRVAALLNVTEDHLDRHPSVEAYAATKARLFEFQQPADYAILNADDPIVMSFAPSIKSQVWQFSRTREVELGTFVRGTEVWVRTSAGESFVCDTANMKLRGKHNLENVLAASAAAIAFGASRHAVQEAVDTIEPPEHRLEPVAMIQGIEFLNNSMCTNVRAAVSSLEAIGRPAVVIAGGKDKGADYRLMGEAFLRYARHVVLIGKDAPVIEKAARGAGFDRISNASTMEAAVNEAWKHAESGDTIVLSPGCASFDMFDDFEHRGRVFKDAVKGLAARVGV
jgi:UDP-N-acetylmuramoylalanine--D-glutamate ligase